MSLRTGCADGHIVFKYPKGFVTEKMINLQTTDFGYGYLKLVKNSLCSVPGLKGMFHCHCDLPGSLECKARTIVLRKMFVNTFNISEMRMPFTFCCTNFNVYRNNLCTHVVIKSALKHIFVSILYRCGIDVQEYSMPITNRVLVEFHCSDVNLRSIVVLAHQVVNLNMDARYGYHLGDHTFWSLESGMYSGIYCSIRFLSFGVGAMYEFQERAVKKWYVRNSTQTKWKGFPKPIYFRNKWRCFYIFEYCECTKFCGCLERYGHVDISMDSALKYLSGEFCIPPALREYIVHHANVILEKVIDKPCTE